MTMTTASLLARAHDGVVDEPDPAARPRRRTFTAEYKARILDEYDALPMGSSRAGRAVAPRGPLQLASRGVAQGSRRRRPRRRWRRRRKPRRSPEQVELEQVRRRNERLEAELAGRRRRWRSREKHTRSWSCSPRARTPTRSRSRDRRAPRRSRRRDVDEAGVRAAGASRATRYRRRRPPVQGPPAPRPAPPNKLTEAERQHVLTVLRSDGVLRSGPGPGVGPAAR